VTCREVADFIQDYQSGELTPDVRREFQRHLDLCPTCRHYIAIYTAAIELGRAVCADETASAAEAGVPQDLLEAILASHRH
jgi:anti-sigma factor RsiW